MMRSEKFAVRDHRMISELCITAVLALAFFVPQLARAQQDGKNTFFFITSEELQTSPVVSKKVTLAWNRSGSRCQASGYAGWNSQSLPDKGTRSIVISRSSTLFLSCTPKKGGETVREMVSIDVPTKPKILSFTASPMVVRNAQEMNVTWSADDADQCSLDLSEGFDVGRVIVWKIEGLSPTGTSSLVPYQDVNLTVPNERKLTLTCEKNTPHITRSKTIHIQFDTSLFSVPAPTVSQPSQSGGGAPGGLNGPPLGLFSSPQSASIPPCPFGKNASANPSGGSMLTACIPFAGSGTVSRVDGDTIIVHSHYDGKALFLFGSTDRYRSPTPKEIDAGATVPLTVTRESQTAIFDDTGKKGVLSDIASGDSIQFSGEFDSEKKHIRAEEIKDTTLHQRAGLYLGTILSVSGNTVTVSGGVTADSVHIDEKKPITFIMSPHTDISASGYHYVSIDDLKPGMSIRSVGGTFVARGDSSIVPDAFIVEVKDSIRYYIGVVESISGTTIGIRDSVTFNGKIIDNRFTFPLSRKVEYCTRDAETYECGSMGRSALTKGDTLLLTTVDMDGKETAIQLEKLDKQRMLTGRVTGDVNSTGFPLAIKDARNTSIALSSSYGFGEPILFTANHKNSVFLDKNWGELVSKDDVIQVFGTLSKARMDISWGRIVKMNERK